MNLKKTTKRLKMSLLCVCLWAVGLCQAADADILKNGQVIKTLAPQTPTFDVTIEDTDPVDGYYRAELTTIDPTTQTWQFAWASPIFLSSIAAGTESSSAGK
ncbi:MAG TPA: hypothetical protein PKH24_21495 [Sedimentisphaerales bacterium]|jgi:hypothetical protein|nr:hypothetical protein [Sedimentisphaerales bacterium]HNU31846.1 hypothetical protein [Sedimentisphaerales bacterium]